jgi:hypothetical protein
LRVAIPSQADGLQVACRWLWVALNPAEPSFRPQTLDFRLWTSVFPHKPSEFRGQPFPGGHPGPLNQKAGAWWDLSLNQLGDALNQSFKLPTNPVKNPRLADEWEPYLQENQKENHRLMRALADAESELNDRAYRLFNLTADEVKLLQNEVEH